MDHKAIIMVLLASFEFKEFSSLEGKQSQVMSPWLSSPSQSKKYFLPAHCKLLGSNNPRSTNSNLIHGTIIFNLTNPQRINIFSCPGMTNYSITLKDVMISLEPQAYMLSINNTYVTFLILSFPFPFISILIFFLELGENIATTSTFRSF